MARPTLGETAMSAAERQARHRAARATGKPALHGPPPARPKPELRSRARRWRDAVAELVELQQHYAAWLETMPENLQNNPTAEALQAICDLDLAELQTIQPPRGFGRD